MFQAYISRKVTEEINAFEKSRCNIEMARQLDEAVYNNNFLVSSQLRL